ncbi:MAG: MauE/DoxX family redox-associated membrane protein [Arenimonas sp.]
MNSEVYIAEIFRFFIAFLLFFAAMGKMKTFSEFRKNLCESFGLGLGTSKKLAPAIIAVEWLLAGIVLLDVNASYFGMLASLLLFLVFTGAVAYQYRKEGIVKCSCFGEAGRSVSIFDLLRNVIVIACIAFYLCYSGEESILTFQLKLLTAGLALILTILAIQFHEIVTLLFPET